MQVVPMTSISNVSAQLRTRTIIGQFSGVLGKRNPSDDYTLNVTRRGVFSAALTGLRDNAALQLRASNGQVIARSTRPGRRSELIRRTLAPGTYFVRVLRDGSSTKYKLAIFDDSNASTPPINPTPPTNPFQNLWGNYRGVGTTTIGTIDPLSGQLTSVNSFQTSIIAEVSAPKTAAGIVETNPFSLLISSSPAEIAANVEGAFSVYSAIPFDFRGGFLLQYWNLEYSGSQITATLINRDSGTALTTNLFNSTMSFGSGFGITFPYSMDIGTTIQGTLTSSELRVRIQGFDSGRTRVFNADVVVERV